MKPYLRIREEIHSECAPTQILKDKKSSIALTMFHKLSGKVIAGFGSDMATLVKKDIHPYLVETITEQVIRADRDSEIISYNNISMGYQHREPNRDLIRVFWERTINQLGIRSVSWQTTDMNLSIFEAIKRINLVREELCQECPLSRSKCNGMNHLTIIHDKEKTGQQEAKIIQYPQLRSIEGN